MGAFIQEIKQLTVKAAEAPAPHVEPAAGTQVMPPATLAPHYVPGVLFDVLECR
jgi:hypothetical protein